MKNTNSAKAKNNLVEEKSKPLSPYKTSPTYTTSPEDEEPVFYWSRW